MVDDSVVVVDDDESKIVTKFLLDTCRLRQPTVLRVHAASQSIPQKPNGLELTGLLDFILSGEVHPFTPLLTGSAAELYIQPMLSCVGDVDIMQY